MREITNNTDCERSVMHHSERDREINQTNITHSERENISLRHSESVGASEEKITQANEGEANLDCERSSEKHPKEVQSDSRHNVQREQSNGCDQLGASEEDMKDCERSIKSTLQPGDCERSISNQLPHQRGNNQSKEAKETGKNRDIGVSSSNKNEDEMVWNITKIKLLAKECSKRKHDPYQLPQDVSQ